ncbi:MAG TPA: HAMP domain-containing sensor histidine kinase [Actinomycetota bacterium]|nr:HAMP domain-containing sensor histidine kinase [Actinomycetota bacterium]
MRITLAFVASGFLLAVILSVAMFFTVGSFLGNQRVKASTRQTIFGVLFAREFLQQARGNTEDVVSLLQTRSGLDAMIIQGNQYLATSLSLTPQVVPADLKSLVRHERLGYQQTRIGSAHELAFGAPLPPPDTALYFFYSLDDIDKTMSVLLRALVVAGFAVVLISAVLAQRVGGRILRPLHEVSTATQRVAEGLLETRVHAATEDEVGVLAASFNEMAAAFQSMLERERRFVANVSHELRTPLSALQTASELLETHRDEFPASSREAVDLIADDVASLRRLVEELMEVSEVDAGKAIIRWEEVDLRALADAVVLRLHRHAAIEGPSVVTLSDKARLERIVSNLVHNAFKHGRGADVHVAVGEQNGTCRVAVSDSGPGIPADALPHLFDRFYKADRSRSRDRGGFGLGLAIAFENARLLGGTIEAESPSGGPTTFTVVIPRRSAPPEETS